MLKKDHSLRDYHNFEEVGGEHARRVTVYPSPSMEEIPVIVNPVSNYTLRNENIVANTELSVTLTLGTKAFKIQLREGRALKVRKTSSGPYWTIRPGVAWEEDSIDPSVSLTFIFETSMNDVLEIFELT